MSKTITILGIESSCDDTAAAVLRNGTILSNVVANQTIHQQYGGVVPELASRAHQQNIIPVVDAALKKAGITAKEIDAIAFTRGPGLIGALLVGGSFAKAFAMGLNIPLIEVNHMQGHILAHFIDGASEGNPPPFPFLCLTISGGHTQIVLVKDYFDMQVLGETRDDAAGETFDKAAKIIGLPYPGGPQIDLHAAAGNPLAFKFSKPQIPGLDFSFSGLKTNFINFIHTEQAKNPDFITQQKNNLCASIQHTIIDILLSKLLMATEQTGIKQIAIAGGVSANKGLRNALLLLEEKRGWKVFIPKFEYCTDNAAMIAITGYLKYQKKKFSSQSVSSSARYELK